MNDSRRYHRAFGALNGFYKRLVSDLADKVVDQEDSLAETYLGTGEDLVERYGHLLLLTQHALMGLHQAMAGDEQKPPEPRFTSFTCPEEEIESRMTEWLDEQKDSEILSFQVLPGPEECRCLVLYLSHRPRR
jgi:hypothetical protein